MRQQQDARLVTVNKSQLIDRIKENKANHIKEYEQAVLDYREEAKKQLKEQAEKLDQGGLDIKISLITPINNSEEYDKIVKIFEWEIKSEVELSQGEFNEYVLDETQFARMAKLSNTSYSKSLSKAR